MRGTARARASRSWRHAAIAGARQRVRAAWWPASQAALAAALAWLIAHRLLGHVQPFFAPIAAASALSTSHYQRSRRIVQMVVGVLLGIAMGELLRAQLGQSTPALGLIVLATLLVARAFAAGFVGDGLMFANQAAGSAILVVAVHHAGTAGERALDAVVGGGVALLVGVVLFPAHPLPRLREAERAVLGSLAGALERVLSALPTATPVQPGWTLAAAYDVHQQLALLAQARATAHANVRIAPRRWRLRALVDAEDRRLARLDLLADGVLSLVRAAAAALEDGQPLSPARELDIAALARAIRRLASTPAPWPSGLLREVGEIAERAIARDASERGEWPPTVASILRVTACELVEMVDPDLRPGIAAPRRGSRPPRGQPAL